MMPDAFPVEPVMRLWGLVASVAILVAILGCRTLSRALDHLARRRAAINPPATAPNLVPLDPLPSVGTGIRLAVGHHEAPPPRAPKLAPERAHVLDLRNQDHPVQPG